MTDSERIDLQRERAELASKIRDIARRIGVAAWPEYVRSELERLARELEFRCGETSVSARDLLTGRT